MKPKAVECIGSKNPGVKTDFSIFFRMVMKTFAQGGICCFGGCAYLLLLWLEAIPLLFGV